MIIMWDFNAKIEKGRSGEYVESFGKRERNERWERFTTMKTYPGADIQSVHNPFVEELIVKLKKTMKQQSLKFGLRKLKSTTIRTQVVQRIDKNFNVNNDNLE